MDFDYLHDVFFLIHLTIIVSVNDDSTTMSTEYSANSSKTVHPCNLFVYATSNLNFSSLQSWVIMSNVKELKQINYQPKYQVI